MKLCCDIKKLYSALQLVSTVVPNKSPREILQNVLIDARDNSIQLAGTDLEVGIRLIVPEVEVEREGKIVAEASKLIQILREARGDKVTIDAPDLAEFIVSYEGSIYNLKGFDPEEYPEVPAFEGDFVEVDAPVLSSMIEQTVFAAAKESMRFAINGVLFVVKNGMAHMVGTDGHRLAWIKKRVHIAEDVAFKGIVPLKALDVLSRLMQDSDEPVKLKLEENFILARCGAGLVASKLVEGAYPNYEDFIPRDNDKIAMINTEEFLSAVRQAAILTSEESKAVRITFEQEKMTLTSRIPERGGAKIVRKIDYDGASIKVGFNPEFLLDMLKVTEDEQVRMELKDKDRPALIKKGDDYVYVIMPVSVEE